MNTIEITHPDQSTSDHEVHGDPWVWRSFLCLATSPDADDQDIRYVPLKNVDSWRYTS